MSETEQAQLDIWADDYLGRKGDATYLAKYLEERYVARKKEAGFVLAVNGEWGMGKTFMLERWSKDMEVAGHPVVRFNSWENDFTPEPLVAFIAELDQALQPYFDRMPILKKYHSDWYKKAKAVLVPCVKVLGFTIAKQAAGLSVDHISELLNPEEERDEDKTKENTKESGKDSNKDEDGKNFDTKELGEKLSKAIDETLQAHTNTKQAILAFKARLGTLIEHLETIDGVQLPVCVFIDELDRCRPDYAIRLLEGIKHLFGVPGLHFVVATNLTELTHSVRAVYGAGFSGDRYLKRFFDLEYSLPIPDGERYSEELMTPLAKLCTSSVITGFEQIFESELPLKGLPFIFRHYAAGLDLSLRDQQQTVKLLDAALITLRGKPIHIHFLIFLAALYQKDSQIYHKVASAKNLSEATGYPAKFSGSGTGAFEIPRYDDAGQKYVSYVSPTEIAKVYFDYLSDMSLPSSQVASDDFPSNLRVKIARTTQDANLVSSYIELIRRAGRFSK